MIESGGSLFLNSVDVVADEPIFHGGELIAVFQHLFDQAALRFDGLPLFEYQESENAIGDYEQDHQKRH